MQWAITSFVGRNSFASKTAIDKLHINLKFCSTWSNQKIISGSKFLICSYLIMIIFYYNRSCDYICYPRSTERYLQNCNDHTPNRVESAINCWLQVSLTPPSLSVKIPINKFGVSIGQSPTTWLVVSHVQIQTKYASFQRLTPWFNQQQWYSKY